MMGEKRVLKIASRGRRFGAGLITWIMNYIVAFCVTFGFCMLLVAYLISMGYAYYSYGYVYDSYGYYSYISFERIGTTFLIIGVILWIAWTVVRFIFYARSQTVGHAILKLQVVDDKTGKPIGFWKMLLRDWIVKPAGAAMFLLGYIWILIDDSHRGWHDKILDTVVIDLQASGINAKGEAIPMRQEAATVFTSAAPTATPTSSPFDDQATPASSPFDDQAAQASTPVTPVATPVQQAEPVNPVVTETETAEAVFSVSDTEKADEIAVGVENTDADATSDEK